MDFDRYRESKKLIAYAVAFEPNEIYELAGNPLPSRLAGAITSTVAREAKEADLNIAIDNDDVTNVLKCGVDDIQSVLHPYFWKHTSQEAALSFIDHERTAQAIAVLALRSEEAMGNLIRSMEKDPYGQRALSLHVQLPYDTKPSPATNRCPAAEYSDTQPFDPVFQKFVRWSGRLALQSLAYHGIVPAFTAGNEKLNNTA